MVVDLEVAWRLRWRAARADVGNGVTSRGQRRLVMCIVDLRGKGFLTTYDDHEVRWPRVPDTEVGTTRLLLSQGTFARQYVGSRGHELCVFDPHCVLPIGLARWTST